MKRCSVCGTLAETSEEISNEPENTADPAYQFKCSTCREIARLKAENVKLRARLDAIPMVVLAHKAIHSTPEGGKE